MITFLGFIWYPLVLIAALGAYGVLLRHDAPPATAAYVPIFLAAVTIFGLEAVFPARAAWRAGKSAAKADAAYMAVVQLALPRVLLVLTTLGLAGWIHDRSRIGLWPHEQPLAVQIVLMVLLVDFTRYWLHRACHRYPLLWRLHQVHHSPPLLYALNVGRFHPAEKVLHFVLDTVPFLMLGVAPSVMAGYFLLYSVNGLFQHSNVLLRYGWLNYVVGSAETHRWHHAVDPAIAPCNFSNTTIVWDLVFATWYLPRGQCIERVGLADSNYPQGFLAQMAAPFRGFDAGFVRGKAWLINQLLNLALRKTRLLNEIELALTLRNPMRAQRALLKRIIAGNRDTVFGRRHGFGGMRGYADFASRIPVSTYEHLRPLVDLQIDSGKPALTRERPLCYVRTSGTTGQPKDLPLTATHLQMLRRIQHTAIAFQHRSCPEAFAGSILAIVSPAQEGTLRNGAPFGSASGIVASNTQSMVVDKFVLPAPVLALLNSRVKYLLILRLALARADISYVGTANPTTLLMLSKLYRQHHAELTEDLRSGTFFLAGELPADVASAVRTRLVPCPERAQQLSSLRLRKGDLSIADLWPNLRLVATWTFASAGVAVDALRHELLPATMVFELGYIASEFRGTMTLGRRAGTGLPTLKAHFFEFVERDLWDRGEPEFLTLDGIRKGIDYYIVVTTPSGLYRYFINDLVRVSGYLHATPLLKFVQKGKGVTNITGEKLYESQLLAAVRAALEEMGRTARFVMMLADDRARGYRLYVETDLGPRPPPRILAERVDQGLAGLNIEYGAKRESQRLEFMEAHWLRPDTGEAYKRFCVGQGQREGQFKTVALAYRQEFAFDLEPFVEDSRIMRLDSIHAASLLIPFQAAFKHGSAERSATQALWIEAHARSGRIGFGEGCPREYVSAESVATARAFVDTYRADWLTNIRGEQDLRDWVRANRIAIDANPAAWTAVELALLDLLGKEQTCSIEALLGLDPLAGRFLYTAVLGDASPAAFRSQLEHYVALGFTQFKIKLSGNLERDQRKVGALAEAGVSAHAVRADANNLWQDADLAESHLTALGWPFFALEEPLQPGDYAGLARLAQRLQTKIILDESLLREEQLDQLPERSDCWIVNLRVSKMGGVLRSLNMVNALRERGLRLIIGAHVGETSVLTRAALTVAACARDLLIAQEGAFGTYLLSADVARPPLMMAVGGVIDMASLDISERPGLGLDLSRRSAA
jgi:sterol desaturase/sphingolipid hydroxylase (fatty acid hydroxylase superfamily)/L-alanine-DL-glutamate epimerase-like enolase superfamily enzyme